MNIEDMKLSELQPEQVVSEKVFRHEYVIDRVFLMRTDLDKLREITRVSMRYRAEEAKIKAKLMDLDAKRIAEMANVIG